MKSFLKVFGVLAIAVTVMTVLNPMDAAAAEPAASHTTEVKNDGTGEYSIKIVNGESTGIKIAGDWFHAYQIFEADELTSYAVVEEFKDFFKGTKIGGDGKTYDFDAELQAITDAADDADAVKTATENYNQLAGLYMESHQNNLYQLAVDLREYIRIDGEGNDYIKCKAHDKAAESGKEEVVTLVGLEAGYYFVLNEESDLPGLGVAASGAFVPVGKDVSATEVVIQVKNSIPKVDKNIWHNDEEGFVSVPGEADKNGKWDMVGDYAIGDTAYFLVEATLPNNIKDYNFDGEKEVHSYEDYCYVFTDTMSEGISYNNNAKIYLDKQGKQALDETLYKFIDPTDLETFKIQVNVKALLSSEALKNTHTLYIHYTGLVTKDAKISKDYENNKIKLEFNNNPSVKEHTGEAEDTVYSYTFDLEIKKMDENLEGLAGAKFGLYKNDTWIPLNLSKTEGDVDYYYLDPGMDTTASEDAGYVITKASGKFTILGLDDEVTYEIREVKAPNGYNAIDPFDFVIKAGYNSTTGMLKTLTSTSDLINNSGDYSGFEADIINRKEVFLPSTGGMGTVIFRIIGGLLMCAAIVYLARSRKKSK